MTSNLHKYRLFALLTLVATVLMTTFPARAFTLDTYTSASRLAQGRWVKVSVTTSGLYFISTADLRRWGFSDPQRVRIYGYGGQRLSDVLSLDNYIDDLPPVQTEVTSRGIVFYAAGIDDWTYSSSTSTYIHSINPFSVKGYYFITEEEGTEAPTPATTGIPAASAPLTTFTAYTYHEKDLVKYGQTGHLILGEDFKWSPSQRFNFTLPDIVTTDSVVVTTSFVANTQAQSSRITITANDRVLPYTTDDLIRASGTSSHVYGTMINPVKRFTPTGEKLQIGIAYTASSTVVSANLNYIEVNYTRRLRLPSEGVLTFDLPTTGASLAGASASTRVWDVTNPLSIYRLNTSAPASGTVTWTNDYTGRRRYVAWEETATLPSPEYEGEVANQNLHDDTTPVPDMVIFTLSTWASEARRIAELHANSADSLRVSIVDCDLVYNEFSSGVPDVNSLRRYLKMLYDRGNAAGTPLRYALIMGKPTFDNRRLTAALKSASYPTLPTWQSETSLDDNISFTTDDIFAFLEDNSGSRMSSDYYSIAVGRIPVGSLADAKLAVDKLYEYVENRKRSSWSNQILMCADDENDGIHMTQSEDNLNAMYKVPSAGDFFVTKVYIDAFAKKDGGYPAANDRMYGRLNRGTLWWNYIGHANPTSWTGEKLLTYKDINNMYLTHFPVLYAATCEFLNWDSSSASGAEIMYFTRQGGIIAAITAVRPVFISDNGLFGVALFPFIATRDDDGRFLSVGEIYRRGKNNFLDRNGNVAANSNKLRYVFMGDPAMRFATPSHRVVVDRINGLEPNEENQVTIMALQRVEVEGHIADFQGNTLSDFNGEITLELYDSEHSTTSHGYEGSKQVTFEEQGEMLFTGRDSVSAGHFKAIIAMPDAIAGNFRPAALNMYAVTTDKSTDAMGINRDFYVYGYDTTAEPDDTPPVIEALYINHPSFTDGGLVNSQPMLIADISDNIGFNLSSVGVGHNFTVQLDGSRLYTDVAQSFTPDMGSRSGRIAYTIPDELTDGPHSLRLRVWDNSGNLTEQTISCMVDSRTALPEIYQVYTDANPASVEANFYISHNRPDGELTVSIEVFNLLGQPVWSSTSTGRSDMFTSSPINWNLCDMAGRRVKRGIYLYRATIVESDGTTLSTASSRIAVTAP